MADLDNLQATDTTKIIGSDSTGVEQTPVQSTAAGALHANLRNASGTEVGTAAVPVRVDPTGTTTQPISASALPLPSGASTAALQTTANTSLANIDTKTPTLGQKPMAGSSPVVISSDQSAIPIAGSSGTAIDNLNSGTGLNALNVALTGTNYILSTANSTTAQLAVNATFTGGIETVFNQQAISLLLTSDQNGVLTVNEYIDAAGAFSIAKLTYAIVANVPFSRAITANGNYVNLTFKNTGTATTTTLNINTAYGTLPAVTALGNGPVSIDEVNGVPMGARPDGFMKVVSDPTTLLFDTFETLDTVNTWTIGGTVVPTGASGQLVLATGTAANASSYANSKPTFIPGASAYLQFAALVQLENGIVTGNQRFWGLGVFGTPSTTAPITNGTVFEIDATTGRLYGSAYSNNVRTQFVVLSKPADANIHRYAIYYKASRVYFEIDNVQVGTLPFPNPQVSALSTVIGSINGASTLGTAPVMTATLIGLGDTARNNVKITDGRYPWRTTTITPAGVAPALTDPALVVTISPNSPALNINTLPTTSSKFSFGQVTTAAAGQVPVIATAYTEQTTNSTMTLVSSSVNDAAAGTGARTVTVTYLDQTMAGPFTTVFTMNGTTAVTASVSNMCFIEKIVVSTVGSTSSNAGILTLRAGATTVATIAATSNQTWWAHHYVPAGKTSYISGVNIGNTSSTAGGGGVFILKASTPTVANTPEIQVSDFMGMPGAAASTTRSYDSPIQVVGPARIRAYVTPNATSTYNSFCSFDYIDN